MKFKFYYLPVKLCGTTVLCVYSVSFVDHAMGSQQNGVIGAEFKWPLRPKIVAVHWEENFADLCSLGSTSSMTVNTVKVFKKLLVKELKGGPETAEDRKCLLLKCGDQFGAPWEELVCEFPRSPCHLSQLLLVFRKPDNMIPSGSLAHLKMSIYFKAFFSIDKDRRGKSTADFSYEFSVLHRTC